MYTFFLHLHAGFRWLILLALLVTLITSLYKLFSGSSYRTFDRIAALSFVMLMRVQFIVGLLLYFFFSPITTRFSFNMDDPIDRFWSVEHLVLMVLAVGAAEMGSSISKKSDDARVKFRFQSILFGISLLLIIAGIPWNRLG